MLTATIVIVALGLLGGATDVAYANVKSRADKLQAALTTELQAGQNELQAGKANLQDANTKHDASLATKAISHFAAAKERFLSASKLADTSELLRYLEYAPVVGTLARSRHQAVDGISQMGIAVSDAGQALASMDEQIIKPAQSGQSGRTLLTVLDQTGAGLARVKSDFDAAKRAALQVNISVVPSGQQVTFLKARDEIATALAGVAEFERLVPVIKEVLGANGPRTYLVEQVNPAELRAGGGFIGSYTLLEADNGVLTILSSGDSYNLASARPHAGQPGFIPLPDPFRDQIPQVSWSFVDSNLFPDFPSNAKAAEQFVHPNGHSLDGVISMDYFTVAKMLELTGPLSLPEFNIIVTGSTFIPQLIQREADPIHKALLSAIVGPLMARVTTLPPDHWPTLLTALNTLSTQRHFQAYFNNERVEEEMDRFGWSGVVNPRKASDIMMEVESNYGGTKANYYLARHYTVVLTREGSVLHHTVTIDLVNDTPYASYPHGFVFYRPYFRLYVGSVSSRLSDNLTPVKFRGPSPPEGTQLLDGWRPDIACCGGRDIVLFQYDTPWPSHYKDGVAIYWQKQPGTGGDSLSVIWNDGSGHSYSANGDLQEDRIITLTWSGVKLSAAGAGEAVLPSLGI